MVAREGSDLDKDTENHDDGARDDGLSAAKAVTENKDKNGTEEASDFVNSRDERLINTVAFCVWKIGVERVGRNDTTHNSLIVTEEEKATCCDHGDHDVERLAGHTQELGNAAIVDLDTSHCCGSMLSSSDGAVVSSNEKSTRVIQNHCSRG